MRSDRGIESVDDTFASAALLNRERQLLEISGINRFRLWRPYPEDTANF
jgi:hypothetical protein